MGRTAFLVLCADGGKHLLLAEGCEEAWREAKQCWPLVVGVVNLSDPVVEAVLQSRLYPSQKLPTEAGPLTIWVDGSSLGNPGPAGWAYVRSDGVEDSGSLGTSTNNVAELTAVLKALQGLPSEAEGVILTDSRNVVGWLQEGWRRKDATVRALAEAIDRLRFEKRLRLRFQHVPTKEGEEGRRVHRLAMEAARGRGGKGEL